MNNPHKLSLHINDHCYPVQSFTGHEALSHPFQWKLHLYLTEPWENPQEFITKNASLYIIDGTHSRYFNGFIYALQQNAFPNQHGLYEVKLKLCSYFDLFNETPEYRIFEQKSVIEIIRELLDPYPLCYYDFSNLQKQYKALPYCVQYQESRSHFIRRLLVNAGINYYFKHEPHKHTMVFIDNALHYLNNPSEEYNLWQWKTRHSIGDKSPHYYAKSTTLAFSPAQLFEYINHRFVILQLVHKAQDLSHNTQSVTTENLTQTYYNQLHAIPSTEYYWARKRIKPPIVGVQIALAESAIQHKGLVLRYPWSTQVPQQNVSSLQAMNSETKKTLFLPKPGTAVLISFQDGDADYPLILGSCYNMDHPPPFYPQQQAWHSGFRNIRSKTEQNNELSFCDEPGAEVMALYAPHNFTQRIGLCQSYSIGQHYQLKIGGKSSAQAKRYQAKAEGITLKAGSSLLSISPDQIVIQGRKVLIN